MALNADEFMHRFLLYILPIDFHRIRHYGLLANAWRRDHLGRVRDLLKVAPDNSAPMGADTSYKTIQQLFVCPDCGAAMIIVEILTRKQPIRASHKHRDAP